MQVITYHSPRGGQIDLTPSQIQMLRQHQAWPMDQYGQEYCVVGYGLHEGTPSYTDSDLMGRVLAAKSNYELEFGHD